MLLVHLAHKFKTNHLVVTFAVPTCSVGHVEPQIKGILIPSYQFSEEHGVASQRLAISLIIPSDRNQALCLVRTPGITWF
jgi:hypothetical protein